MLKNILRDLVLHQFTATLCSRFMRFRFTRFSIYAVFGNSPNTKYLLNAVIFSHYALIGQNHITFAHSAIFALRGFSQETKKGVNRELSVHISCLFPHLQEILHQKYVQGVQHGLGTI